MNDIILYKNLQKRLKLQKILADWNGELINGWKEDVKRLQKDLLREKNPKNMVRIEIRIEELQDLIKWGKEQTGKAKAEIVAWRNKTGLNV